jgi:hypothetical protein
MNTYGTLEVELHAFLNSALHGGKRSASRPTALPPEESRRYTLDRRLYGPQNRSGAGGEEKYLCQSRESNPVPSSLNLVTILTDKIHREKSLNYLYRITDGKFSKTMISNNSPYPSNGSWDSSVV